MNASNCAYQPANMESIGPGILALVRFCFFTDVDRAQVVGGAMIHEALVLGGF